MRLHVPQERHLDDPVWYDSKYLRQYYTLGMYDDTLIPLGEAFRWACLMGL